MFAKLVFVILACAVTAAALLVTRQQRLESAHTMAQVHEQILLHERNFWNIRAEIAAACRPERVRAQLESLGSSWTSIPDPAAGDPAHAAPRTPPRPRDPPVAMADPAAQAVPR